MTHGQYVGQIRKQLFQRVSTCTRGYLGESFKRVLSKVHFDGFLTLPLGVGPLLTHSVLSMSLDGFGNVCFRHPTPEAMHGRGGVWAHSNCIRTTHHHPFA